MVLRMQGVGLMTDLEFEERLAEVERSIDSIYTHVLMLSLIALVAVMFFIASFLWGVV